MDAPVERVVLLGFMAAGKTTVGARLAARLGWDFRDFDREIEREQGSAVEEIFVAHGERHFRALEAEITPRLLRAARTVLSTGGGWVTNPALLELIPPGTLTVWLVVSPEAVVRRLAGSPGAPARPLLRGADPLAAARALLAQREPLYRRAEVAIDTEIHGPGEIVEALHGIIRGRNGAPGRSLS